MTANGQANVKPEDGGGLARLDALATAVGPAGRGRPPLHLWNPDFCGFIDMRIAADGAWFYGGTPIGRPALVRLFASVLRHERGEGRHVLVTPVEKVGIVVEDAPFVAVEMRVEDEGGRRIGFRTNVDDWTVAGPDAALRFERDATGGVKPYVRVRDDLWALVTRAVTYDLLALGERRPGEGAAGDRFGVVSGGVFFDIAGMAEAEGLA